MKLEAIHPDDREKVHVALRFGGKESQGRTITIDDRRVALLMGNESKKNAWWMSSSMEKLAA